jgi:hypothetical protein
MSIDLQEIDEDRHEIPSGLLKRARLRVMVETHAHGSMTVERIRQIIDEEAERLALDS